MKTMLVLLLTCVMAFAQTKEELTPYLPMGRQMAYEAYVAKGGGRISKGGSRNPAFLYQSGPIKGLTKEQADVRFSALWHGLAGSVKEKYAKMAYHSGRGTDVNAYLTGQKTQKAETADIPLGRITIEGDTMKKDGIPYAVRSGSVWVPLVSD